jgi:hypothetical protein
MSDIEGNARGHVFELLAETKAQPHEPPKKRADAQVVSLDMACAY